jgi:hypothetical protein
MNHNKTSAREACPGSPQADKDLVLRSCIGLTLAGYGFISQCEGSPPHLYLASGEIYRIGESDLTRIR